MNPPQFPMWSIVEVFSSFKTSIFASTDYLIKVLLRKNKAKFQNIWIGCFWNINVKLVAFFESKQQKNANLTYSAYLVDLVHKRTPNSKAYDKSQNDLFCRLQNFCIRLFAKIHPKLDNWHICKYKCKIHSYLLIQERMIPNLL